MIDVEKYLSKSTDYLKNHLIPFWEKRIEEPEFGGFQSNYDRNGFATAVQDKTFLCQARCLFTLSFVLRQGFEFKRGEEILEQGYEFIQKHLLDRVNGGYYWIVNKDGSVQDENKVLYGHSFLLYALSEWAQLTGSEKIKKDACALFDLIQEKALDEKGGYIEHFKRDFTPRPARGDVGCHKSLDVHMHLMEAFTCLYELTGEEKHKAALDNVVSLILVHMIDMDLGTGISMFTQEWKPIANVELDTVWGADRFEDEKSIDITSYGHNIELAWLFTHMLRIRGLSFEPHMKWLTS
ncbi:MAG: AGE family epimerase/isomerase, partial [Lentisphaeraceae bacterium]|nr:AGE family epimerase/isomerase [Lentisphaeraceae bacterium]